MPSHSQHSAKVAEIVATAARTVQARSLAVRRSGAELFVRASRTPVPAVKYFLPAPCLRAVAPIGWYSLAVPSVSAALNSGREDKYGFHIMADFQYYQDVKITVWERKPFMVCAQSQEEADRIAASCTDSIYDIEDCRITPLQEDDTLYETAEILPVDENGGSATIEVFTRDHRFIADNRKNQ